MSTVVEDERLPFMRPGHFLSFLCRTEGAERGNLRTRDGECPETEENWGTGKGVKFNRQGVEVG